MASLVRRLSAPDIRVDLRSAGNQRRCRAGKGRIPICFHGEAFGDKLLSKNLDSAFKVSARLPYVNVDIGVNAVRCACPGRTTGRVPLPVETHVGGPPGRMWQAAG
ncbi:hypothetical protein [Protofrankia coriariae]|uniref:hypothetical protein n=1 Tax=Protofrankia coriariae TaxID=1562887 RepID=UPI000AC59671|nr:hypothetical protein [Protofrankia coriariae]